MRDVFKMATKHNLNMQYSYKKRDYCRVCKNNTTHLINNYGIKCLDCKSIKWGTFLMFRAVSNRCGVWLRHCKPERPEQVYKLLNYNWGTFLTMVEIEIVGKGELKKMMQDVVNLLQGDYKHVPYELKVYALENLKHTLLRDLNDTWQNLYNVKENKGKWNKKIMNWLFWNLKIWQFL